MPGLDTNTKLLIHSDGDDGSYAVIDSGFRSAMGGTQPGGHGTGAAFVGTAAISATQSKFGGTSLYLDGNSDCVTVPDSDDWNFGTDNFTIDFWFNATAQQQGAWISQYANSTNRWYFWYNFYGVDDVRNELSLFVRNTAGIIASYSVPWLYNTSQWHHMALVRDNASTPKILFFIDGVKKTLTETTAIGTWPDIASTLDVGQETGFGFTAGYIDEVRISKGIARWTADFTAPTAPYTADGKTNLLLHFDAADTPFTGATAKVGTFVGTAQHKPNDAAVAMIGNGSLALDGNSDYVTVPDSADWDFGTGDWTVDFWFNSTTYTGARVPIGTNASSSWIIYIESATKIDIYYSDVLASIDFTVSTLQINTWYHLAVVRSGNNLSLFLNGVQQGASQSCAGISYNRADAIYIGMYKSSCWWSGYIDELRISKGTAVWTADFIPSIVPYTATTAANTVLLCHFDNWQVDSETTPKALTQVGTAYNTGDYVVGATSPAVGAGAWRFDGTDDYLTYPDAADWSFGVNNFTVDCWVRFGAIDALQTIVSQYEGADDYWHMDITAANKLQMVFEENNTQLGNYIMTSAWSGLQINTWYHIAFIRNNAAAVDGAIYINGVAQTITETTAFGDVGLVAGILEVGSYDSGNYLNGYLDNLRILKGTAAWTSAFTPPTTAYTGSDIPTSGNGLYVPFDYSGVDIGGSAHVPTYVSNTYGATALSRFTGSILLDGNSDYVTFADSDDFSFGDGNFTIDGWVLFKGIGAIQVITSQYEDANNYWYAEIDAANKLTMIFKDGDVKGSYIMTSAWAGLQVNVWYHIAFVRNTTTGLIFINGVSQSLTETTAFGTNNVGNIAGLFEVGDYDTGNNYLNGYLDELRVSKGIARWTSAFTPPTEPYALAAGPAGIYKIMGVTKAASKKIINVNMGSVKKLIGVA